MVAPSRRCSATSSLRIFTRSSASRLRQRLVEQERLGLLDDGAADGDALALAARQLRGRRSSKMRDLQDVGGAGDARGDLGLRQPLVLEAEAQVLVDAHVRVERVGLEHHGHAARRRHQMVAARAVDIDLAVADVLEAGDHAQQRRLAAAGGADEDGEGAVIDLEVDAVDDLDATGSSCGPPLSSSRATFVR